MRNSMALSFCTAIALSTLAFGADGAASSVSKAKSDGAEQTFYDRYAVLVERNIFSKNRPHVFRRPGAVAEDARRERETRREAPLEESFVLTGIVREGMAHTAFIENVRSGATSKAKTGDSVAHGKLAEIGLDHLDYEAGGRTLRVELGHNLAGGASKLASKSAPSSPPAAPSSSPAGSDKPAAASSSSSDTKPAEASSGETKPEEPAAGADDALERLKKKRLEEMKK